MVFRDELTLHVRREQLPAGRPDAARRTGPALRAVPGRHRRALSRRDRPRVARCVPAACRSPTTAASGWKWLRPTLIRTSRRCSSVYPTNDWHERETYDFFGIIFDGHPALTRIEMPDDWEGHPQRKDYPLGGIPVEYKGAQIPPPDERRAYN